MEPYEIFELKASSLFPIVYTGPLCRIRPAVKWLLIAYWVVIVGISALILKEKSVGRAVLEALPVTAICMAWLVPTRTRNEWRPTPVKITFGRDRLIWDYPAKPSLIKGEAVERHERFVLPYAEITNIHYQAQIHRISVWGTVISTIWPVSKNGIPQGSPLFRSVKEKAAWGANLEMYNSPGEVRRFERALSHYTGKQIERHGRG